MKPFYISTSIPYPNANPHIGFALELVQADFLARYYRLVGRSVWLSTGLDEHGLKIQKTAAREGVSELAFVDTKAIVFQELAAKLQIEYDCFVRTNEQDHQEVSRAVWLACLAKGDIYKKQYRAWYNIKEEEFLGMADEIADPAAFGVDPSFIELIDEENYFFRLSRYNEAIKEVLNNGSYKIVPENRRVELLKFMEARGGLQDISISRQKSKLSWGIEVPNDPEQVMYVWYDALTNYLTAALRFQASMGEGKASNENIHQTLDGLGKLQNEGCWPADIHIVGKDISRFHALIWTGMLLSAGISLPKELLVHGFVISGGQKMSKSTGNVIDPIPVIEEYGSDALRWYLLKEIPTGDDGDFTNEHMAQVYKADLANDFGNLVSRVYSMVQKYSEGKVPLSQESGNNPFKEPLRATWESYHRLIGERKINQALQVVQAVIVLANQAIDENKPWQLAKDPIQKERLNELLYSLLEVIRQLCVLLSPVMPEAVGKVRETVFPGLEKKVWESFAEAQSWGVLPGGLTLGQEPIILFPRHD